MNITPLAPPTSQTNFQASDKQLIMKTMFFCSKKVAIFNIACPQMLGLFWIVTPHEK